MTTIDHNEYPRRLRSKSWAELKYIAQDAKEAYNANPEGAKAGYYLDEINYVCNEMNRRREETYYGQKS